MLLGIDLSREEYLYNQRTFDVKYRYNIDDDPMYIERTRLPEPPVSQPKKAVAAVAVYNIFKENSL